MGQSRMSQLLEVNNGSLRLTESQFVFLLLLLLFNLFMFKPHVIGQDIRWRLCVNAVQELQTHTAQWSHEQETTHLIGEENEWQETW